MWQGLMLRAMMEALQAHAEAHPGEPFDHERHMPDCMRAARDDPTTWASSGHLVRRAAIPAYSRVRW